MDDACVGALFVLRSGAGVGTLGVLGVVVGDAGLSVLTVLFLRFGLAAVVVWTPWPPGANYGVSGAGACWSASRSSWARTRPL